MNEEKLREYLKKVTADLHRTRRRLQEADARDQEPIAIVGMACRYPGGVSSPEELWQLVADGTDAVGEFPTDRGWATDLYDPDPDRPGKSYAHEGGFLYQAADFDAEFYGISPREAVSMDPQQRLLLEAAWEAMERAGIDPASVRGSAVGVYVGVMYNDYASRLAEAPPGLEGYLGNGSAASVASGRVSYALGLEGPAVTVDTACSSSLVALHLAAQALRRGECEMALTGGVTVMSTPSTFVGFSRQRGLAPDGRCKPFSDDADGTGWGEGVGLLLVERLSDARARGHRVLAVVRGSAVNQDGASSGLTAPNGPSQQRVIRQALSCAGIPADGVDVVEAHGTGTSLGDPIEAQALLAVYGKDRPPDRPLWLGSVKSNLGHTQAAAGVAGVIKMVQALQRGVLPATLHVSRPSSHVDWSAGAVELLTESRAWPVADRPRRAAVSAFGISGTNTHVILEQVAVEDAGDTVEPALRTPPVTVWPLSARTGEGLRAQARRLSEYLRSDPDARPLDIGWSLATTRSAFPCRAALVGADRTELLTGLSALAGDGPGSNAVPGAGPSAGPVSIADVVTGVSGSGRAGWLFTGQGAQWIGMGRELYDSLPVFATAMDRICAHLDPMLERPIGEVMFGSETSTALDQTGFTQPAVFAVEVALAELLGSWGLVPDVVVGHSVGEVAAAYVAGVFSLADACRLVAARGRLMQALPSGGVMLAVAVSEERIGPLLGAGVSLAAVNGPSAVVVSGDRGPVERVAEHFAGAGVKVSWLRVSHAFHSARMDPMLDQFRVVAESLTYQTPRTDLVSTVTGQLADADMLCDAAYWVSQVRAPVRFADAVATLRESGVSRFAEVGPDAVLTAMLEQCLPADSAVTAVAMLRRSRPQVRQVLTAVAGLQTSGAALDWAAVFGPGARRADLPTYAFQRQRYWLDADRQEAIGTGRPAGVDAEFWDAVERGDVGTVAGHLRVDDVSLAELLPALASWRRRLQDESTVEDWCYRETWTPLPDSPPAGFATGRWLVVSGESVDASWPSTLADGLTAHGATVTLLSVGDTDSRELTADRVRNALSEAGTDPHDVAGVLSLLGIDERDGALDAQAPPSLAGNLRLVQALGDAGVGGRLWWVTCGAVSLGGADPAPRVVGAGVWGLGRVVGLELPDRWGGLVDLPAEALSGGAAARWSGWLAGVLGGVESQVAVRGSGVFGRRLVRMSAGHESSVWVPSGTVLVTGGTGAVGGHVARWLAASGVGRVVLVSRRGGDAPGAADLVGELEALGSSVVVESCDVSDRGQVAGLVGGLVAGGGLDAVVHAAGVVDDGVVERMSAERLAGVVAAKAVSAVVLDEATRHLGLSAFVVFSSLAGVVGSAGQGGYAAANAMADAVVAGRRAAGLPGVSVAWGPWGGGGMADRAVVMGRLGRGGVRAMDPGLAVGVLGRLVGGGVSVVVADVEWARFGGVLAAAGGGALVSQIPEARAAVAVEAVGTDGGGWRDRLLSVPVGERVGVVLGLVLAEVALVLGHSSAQDVAADRAFRDLGFDSLTAVELRNRLNTATGLRLPTTTVFDYPSAGVLAAELCRLLLGDAAPTHADEPLASVARADDPVVIVAMGCRFPGGVASADDLWNLVSEGVDAVSGFPADRCWDLDGLYHPDPDHAGTSYAREGGFLTGATEFDAAFFGISPREAVSMDPQQRLLLETAWETFEQAGLDPLTLRGTRVGVFAGTNGQDYQAALSAARTLDEGLAGIGNTAAVLSGRISYVLGLEGPAVTVDTACSSSLVALHWAVQALQRGECSLALAGGVTVMSTPGAFTAFSRQRGLAPDGRCKAFSDDADGTGWGEGVGLLLLERRSDAERNGHQVLAVVRGSAVNQDGASNGMTAPNGPSQQRVIRQALASAGVAGDGVDVVEAHGTGTALGDPIEAQALVAAYGSGRDPDRPLWLGSVKSNIGHTQAAAGVAGIIKMVQALRHGVLPPTLHVSEPSSQVDWGSGEVRLLTERTDWPEVGRPRRAAVSSFGISGTNAHVILEQPAAEEPPVPVDHSAADLESVWPLSARSSDALRAQAQRLLEFLVAAPEARPADIGWSLASTRSAFPQRAAVLGAGRGELMAGLSALAAGRSMASVVTGVAGSGKTAWVFSGQGAQWVGMGRELYEVFPVFAEALDRVCAEFDAVLDRPLREVMLGAGIPGRSVAGDGSGSAPALDVLDQTGFTQPAVFAIEVALAELLGSWGMSPDVVAGHSVGEISGAYVAGVFGLADACRLVAARGRLMQDLPAGGVMLAVAASEEQIAPWLGAGVSLAAVNGPSAVVVSGDRGQVEQVAEHFRSGGAKVSWLRVSHAFHSARMDPMLEQFRVTAESVTYEAPRIDLVSTVTGQRADADVLCRAGYWVSQVREPVRFASAVGTLRESGVSRFVEVGPDAVLTAMLGQCLPAESAVTTVAVLRRGRPQVRQVLTAVAGLQTSGCVLDWAAVFGPGARQVLLPTYAFQRQRYWPPLELSAVGQPANAVDAGFWDAVERGDVGSVAETLRVPDASLADLMPALASWRRRRHDESVVDGWCYRETWAPMADPLSRTLSGRWLVCVPAGHDATTGALGMILNELTARGAQLLAVTVAAGDDRTVIAERIRSATDDGGAVAGVLSLLGLADDTEPRIDTAGHASRSVALLASVVQALGDAGVAARLWWATCGAACVDRADPAPSVTGAGVWGLGRVVGLELPDRWGGLVDLPAEALSGVAGTRWLDRLVGVLGGVESQVAVRGSGVFGRRLVRAVAGDEAWVPSGTVLVTGGTGAVGGHVARWLAAAGAERLVLVSRRGGDAPGVPGLVAELEALGSSVVVVESCDVSDRGQVAGLVGGLVAGGGLDAVVHAAGVLDDGVVDGLTVDRVRGVVGAKAVSAVVLDEATRHLGLSAFVVFSSLAGVVGSAGQGGYAAANAMADAVVAGRRAAGVSGVSVAWGPWAGGGMAGSGVVVGRLGRGGVCAMDPTLAVGVLGRLVGGGVSVVVADVEWARFGSVLAAAGGGALVEQILQARAAVAVEGTDGGGWRDRLSGMPAGDRRGAVLGLVCGEVAVVLGYSGAEDVSEDRAFRELGFDSLTAVELRNALGGVTGLSLSATVVFDYPTPAELAGYLLTELTDSDPVVETSLPAAVSGDDPVVIVGMGCRYPGGVRSPDELWRLVAEGSDTVSAFPTDRGWDIDNLYDPDGNRPGTTYVREGGFLHGASEFDAGFFGISPREATSMDPQQRLLLETAWETLEHAAIDPTSVRGARVGVFAGTSGQDYISRLATSASMNDGFAGTGNSGSVLSGRISYVFGLEGPAVTVDTACSSSLVALHLAAQALQKGECDLAFAGGVTVMSTPGVFAEFSRQGGLSMDGRCKAFSDDADGTGWGEGVGLLLVERLSDARTNGHRILAVVKGSGVNQDGASNGLTAPNGPSQQRVIRQALASAGVSADGVDAVEAHGTGTALGDPIEAQALLATYGQGRESHRPLLLGSVKSNIGHTQAASGVAGVIKMVEAMRRGALPATLHVSQPSSEVDWASGGVRLLTEHTAWPVVDRPRRAGVSSFGISGTNAHVILEQAPAECGGETLERASEADPLVMWVLSGRSVEGLAGQARRLSEFLEAAPEVRPVDVGWSLASTRAALPYRAAVVGGDRAELVAGLAAVAEGGSLPQAVTGVVGPGRTAWVFSGQGGQWVGMGRELYESFPVFAEALDRVCAEFAVVLDRPLREVMLGADVPDGSAVDVGSGCVPALDVLDQTGYTQPAVFAIEVALAELLGSWGMVPDVVAGHSVGEVVAAYVAGVFSLVDACRLVAARGGLMQALPSGGVMLAVAVSEERIAPWLGTGVSLAGVNGPSAVVVSGDGGPVERIAEHFRGEGVRVSWLRVSHAFHSARMDPMLDQFRAVAESLTYGTPRIGVVSTVTGEVADAGLLGSPEYWVSQVREPVRFAAAVDTLRGSGVSRFVELGPDAVLTAMIGQCLSGDAAMAVAVQRRDRSQVRQLLTTAARLQVSGVGMDWAGVFGPGARRVDLPTYAFQCQRYWPDTASTSTLAAGEDVAFWDAVERGDVGSLAGELRVEGSSLAEVVPALASWRQRRHDESVVDGWCYRETWTPLADVSSPPLPGRWLVVSGEGIDPALVNAVADAMRRSGAELTWIAVADTDIRGQIAERIRGVLAEAGAGVGDVAGVVSLLGLAEAGEVRADDTVRDASAAVALLASVVQALGDAGVVARLWCVTCGAVCVDGADPAPSVVGAGLWGLGRVVALELPDRWGGLVDLPVSGVDVDGLVDALGAGESQVAVRGGGVFGRRLVRAVAGGDVWVPSGTVLVTGGTGVLGSRVARWLVSVGVGRVVLVSRRGLAAPGAVELVEALGSSVVVVESCDVSDRGQVAGLVGGLVAGGGLDAVVHAAGVLDDGVVDGLTVDRVRGVVGAKAVSAVVLDEATRHLGLSAFVVFSSLAGVVGSAGQGGYAAANAMADAVVAGRRAAGVSGVSVAWGPWAGGGMAGSGVVVGRLGRGGVCAMDPTLAVGVLGRLVGGGVSVVVADVEWARFGSVLAAAGGGALVEQILQARTAPAAGDSGSGGVSALEAVRAAGPGERHALLLGVVRERVAQVLGHDRVADVPADRAFRDLGFDSLTAVELRNALGGVTGLSLSATVVFDYPTPAALAGYLLTELTDSQEDRQPVLAPLDLIEATIAENSLDADGKSALGARLRGMLSKLGEVDGPGTEPGAGAQLGSATDDEIFEFIHKELGRS